ncbi:MAG: hypothetical protein E7565_07810 [Ruminococcaceae bacterium]|nr:hypothetical protein [Oscillospiraceae bacterium]
MEMQKTFKNKQVLETRYKNSRANLLLVVVFSLINIILLITNSNTYFLFSAYIPYGLVDIGMLLCGKYPAEYYGEEFSSMQFMGASAFAVFVAVAFVLVALYFLSWLFSKKHKIGWMIFALVFFVIDTVAMLLILEIKSESIIDIVFHVWVIVSLILGINACSKLKKIPTEINNGNEINQAEDGVLELTESVALRIADSDVKARVLIESEVLGHCVVYRRVKKTNELVIDSYVYDEIEILVECAHSLEARIDGHLIVVGFDGVSHSYLSVDGEIVAKKLRLI